MKQKFLQKIWNGNSLVIGTLRWLQVGRSLRRWLVLSSRSLPLSPQSPSPPCEVSLVPS